jgi:hypothetical protein
MCFVRSDVKGPRRFPEKRPGTFVLALPSIPASELSNDQQLRDFQRRSIFDFFNSLGAKRPSFESRDQAKLNYIAISITYEFAVLF